MSDLATALSLLRMNAGVRLFGMRDVSDAQKVRHGYLLALEEIAQALATREERAS